MTEELLRSKYVDVISASKMLRSSQQHVRDLIAQGKLPVASRLSSANKTLVPFRDVEEIALLRGVREQNLHPTITA